jgi:hypothetical protein
MVVLLTVSIALAALPSLRADGIAPSDKIRIVASMEELGPIPESQKLISFTSSFPDNPAFTGGTVFLYEGNDMKAESDRVTVGVRRPDNGPLKGMMIVSMEFRSDIEGQPEAGTPVIAEGRPVDLTDRADIFGAALPFKLTVFSANERQPSNEPSDTVTIESPLVEPPVDGVESFAIFRGIFNDNAQLNSGVFFLTEPADATTVSDTLQLQVIHLVDDQDRPIGMDVSLTLSSDQPEVKVPLPDGANSTPENGRPQPITPDFFGAALPFEASLQSDPIVPEPSSLVLLSLGTAGLLTSSCRTWRKRAA